MQWADELAGLKLAELHCQCQWGEARLPVPERTGI